MQGHQLGEMIKAQAEVGAIIGLEKRVYSLRDKSLRYIINQSLLTECGGKKEEG